MTFLSPCWRSLNPLKGSLNHPNFESPGRCSFFSPFFGIFQLPNLNAPAGFAAFAKPQDSIQCISDGILGKNTLEMGNSPKSWKSRNQLLRDCSVTSIPFAASTYYKLWVIHAFLIIYIYMFNVSVLESVTLGVFAGMSLKELSLSQFVNLQDMALPSGSKSCSLTLVIWSGACGVWVWIGMDGLESCEAVFSRGNCFGDPEEQFLHFKMLKNQYSGTGKKAE